VACGRGPGSRAVRSLGTLDHGAVEFVEVFCAHQRPGVGGSHLIEQFVTLSVRGIRRRAVQRAHMVERHAAGAAGAGDCAGDFGADRVPRDHAAEAAVLAVVVAHRTGVRAGRDQHRAVFQVGVVQHHADRQDVVIGVRVECPILVPFYRRTILRRLHVQLGAVACAAPDRSMRSGSPAPWGGEVFRRRSGVPW